MSKTVPPSLEEVWEWKRQTEEETRGLSRKELIEFYRKRAQESARRLGLDLPSRKASQNRRDASKSTS